MAYSAFSTKISSYISRELDYDDERQAVLAYALDNILWTAGGFIAVVVFGLLLGVVIEAVCASLAGGLLRKFSGGAHTSTPFSCMALGAVVYSLVGMGARHGFALWGDNTYLSWAFIGAAVFCVAIVSVYAPVDSKAKPIVSRSFRRKLWIGSVITVTVFCILAWLNKGGPLGLALLGGVVVQVVSLLPVLNKRR